MVKTIDGRKFQKMIILGADNLSSYADYVDSLNVFPVPDGDTGTNMKLSIQSGKEEVVNNSNDHIGEVGKVFAKGLLMGARGNSGVILSQLFRGFSKHIEDEEQIDAKMFASAFQAGVKTAYKLVIKPVEGTILTVAKDAANKATELAEDTDDVEVIMDEVYKEAKASLKRTPDLLPVLKEVGVVDSGGQGLVYVYEGFLRALNNQELDIDQSIANFSEDGKVDTDSFVNDEHDFLADFMSTEDIIYGFCTEFMVRFQDGKKPFDEEEFRNDMGEFGDSLLVLSDDEVVKTHVHSEHPGQCLTYAEQYGEIIKIKIENMREQHREVLKKQQDKELNKKVDFAVIAISMGDGISEIFKGLGVTHIISGGQTMNPSTDDIAQVIKKSGAKKALILPNNKNIIMAANQVDSVVDAEVEVVETKTIPQGLAALLGYNPDESVSVNKESMTQMMEDIQSGSITNAVRNTTIDGVEIKEGQFMAIQEGKIIKALDQIEDTLKHLLDEMIDEDSEIVTIISGEEADSGVTERTRLYIEEQYEDVEVEIHKGRQPVYPYLVSVE